MIEVVRGVSQLPELDQNLLKRLEGLRNHQEKRYSASPLTYAVSPRRTRTAHKIIKPFRAHARWDTPWVVRSGLVVPGKTHIPLTKAWHSDKHRHWLAFDALPPEILCVELPDGVLSCRKKDVTANEDLWAAAQDLASDHQIRQLGGAVIPLEPGFYQFDEYPVHRGTVNNTDEPVQRTAVLLNNF